jgi:hypothetical protein
MPKAPPLLPTHSQTEVSTISSPISTTPPPSSSREKGTRRSITTPTDDRFSYLLNEKDLGNEKLESSVSHLAHLILLYSSNLVNGTREVC